MTDSPRHEALDDPTDGAAPDPDTQESEAARPRPRRRGAVILLALVAAALAGWGVQRLAANDPTLDPPASDPPPGTVRAPEGSTLIATLGRDIDAYDAPRGERTGTVAATWHGRVSALPVIDQEPGWLRVRLAPRPNGSTAWVRQEEVELSTTPYRIEIDVATMRLRLHRQGDVVVDAPAGIGRDETPTPVGRFFVAFFQEAPSPEWGPFVIVTSAHSETISDWEESGDAITAIHGPLGSDRAIGETGAKVSAGCVRLHMEDIAALRDVPAGSPVDIVDSSEAAGT